MPLSGLGIAATGHPVDHLNPTTWTGDCGFFFPGGLNPVHPLDFRSVDEALELFVADAATPRNALFIHPRAFRALTEVSDKRPIIHRLYRPREQCVKAVLHHVVPR